MPPLGPPSALESDAHVPHLWHKRFGVRRDSLNLLTKIVMARTVRLPNYEKLANWNLVFISFLSRSLQRCIASIRDDPE